MRILLFLFSTFLLNSIVIADNQGFPTGTFRKFSELGAHRNMQTGEWIGDILVKNGPGRSSIDTLEIHAIPDGLYIVSIEATRFASKYYYCRFAGIFKENYDDKTKKIFLEVNDDYKQLQCNLRITSEENSMALHGDCNQFCGHEGKLGGLIFSRKIPASLRKFNGTISSKEFR